MKIRLAASAIGAAALAVAAPALAHHSGSMFDREKTVTLVGTVKSYAYTQPHSWIDMIVLGPDGKEDDWGIECGAPTAMHAQGIVPSVLKSGDKVTLRMHPLRDGRHQGSFIDVILADGRRLGLGPNGTAPVLPATPTN
jgi:hypothetical protein